MTTRRGPRRERRGPALLVACAVAAALIAGGIRSDRLSAAASVMTLTPLGASPGVLIQITGRGFDPAPANNQIAFTPLSGPAVTVVPASVATLSPTTGLRRLSVVVPDLPIGATAVRVTNTVTHDVAPATLQVIGISLPDTASAALGDQQVSVSIQGSANTQFVAGRTTVSFGGGVTVSGVDVLSPTALVATISISPTTAAGHRTVTVVSSTQTARLVDGFDVVGATSGAPPAANAGADQTVSLGSLVTLNGSASSDPDGDPLSYAWTLIERPAGSSAVLSDPAAVQPTFEVDQPGTYRAQLVVSDGRSASAPDEVRISTRNSPPVANAGASQSVHVGDTVRLDGRASTDPDGDPLVFEWSFMSRPAGSAAALTDGGTAQASFTADVFGDYVLQLVVSDGQASSDPALVTISTLNTAPVASAGPDRTALVGATVTLSGAASSDADGNPLTYRWSLAAAPDGSAAVLSDLAAVDPTLTLDRPGTYVVQLIVNDGSIDSLPDTMNLTTVNSPPRANAGADQTVPASGLVQLNGTGSTDVDGDALTYRWSLTTVPAGSAATLSDAAAANPTFVADLAGTYIAQLIVNDGTVDSPPDPVVITGENLPPVANAGADQTIALGSMATLDGSASQDPNGDPLTFTWSLLSVPAGSAAALSDPASATPGFVVDRPGSYVVQLVVSDGIATSAADTVTISTLNSAPQANAGPDQSLITGARVQLDGSGSSDADGSGLTYTWSILSRPTGSTAALSNTAIVNPTFVASLPGTYVVQLIVSDGTLESDPDTVAITVQDGSDLKVWFETPPASTPPVGGSINFLLRLDNLGPAAATGITARLVLPAGLTLVNTGLGTYDPASGVWTVGSLPVRNFARLAVSARVNQSGPYDISVAIVHGDQPDPDPANNSAATSLTPNQNADIGVSFVSAPTGTVLPGSVTSFFVQAVNTGPAAATDVVVSVPVPPGYTFNGVGFVTGSYDSATGLWTIGSMVSGARPSLAVSLRVNPTGPLAITAAIAHSSQPDPNPANDTATSSIPNRPPVANAGADQSGTTQVGVTLDGNASFDGDGEALTYKWAFTLRAPNSTTTLAGDTTAAPTFVPDQPGRYIAQLIVTDARGLASTADTVLVTVAQGDRAPAIFSTPVVAAAAGEAYRYDVDALDPDAGDALTYALDVAPAGMTIDPASGVITWTPGDPQGGQQVVNVSVHDATGLAATQAFTIQVSSSSNRAPLARDDAYEVRAGESLGVPAGGVLANDADADAAPLAAHLVSGPRNGTLSLNPDGGFTYTPSVLREDDLVRLDHLNLATRVPGVTVEGTTTFNGGAPSLAVDESVGTYWRLPFYVGTTLAVVFPSPVTVSSLQVLGIRDPFALASKMRAREAVLRLLDGNGTELFNTGNIDLPLPDGDVSISVPEIAGVRRALITLTNNDTGNQSGEVGIAEFRVIGSTVIPRPHTTERNLNLLLPVTARASSAYSVNQPDEAFDDSIGSNWYSPSGAAGEFIEFEYPVDVTVNQIEMANPAGRPDGFGTSLGIDCSGHVELFDGTGTAVFNSGVVHAPFGAVGGSIVTDVAVPDVSGVRRVRWTSEGCGPSFPPGFSEFRVFGSAPVEAPAFTLATRLQALVGLDVHSTPLVGNFSDDNHDGRIDADDVPDIVAIAEQPGGDHFKGAIHVVSGDDGHELFTAGAPDLVSPWSEAAIGSLDGDTTPEIVAVSSDHSHLIAFEHTGEVRWVSDANTMPRFDISISCCSTAPLATGAVSIANLDRTGPPEIVVGASVFDANGHLLGDGRTLGGTTGGNGMRSAISAIADLDLDGPLEIVAGPTAYRLVNGQLTIAWRRTDRPDGFAAIGNFDDDPFPEIVIVGGGQIYMLNHDGTDAEVWNPPSHAPIPIPTVPGFSPVGGAPTIADLDGDGRPEIGVAGIINYFVFNRDGSLRWKASTIDHSSFSTGSTVFDLDGDGDVEVIYRDEEFLHIYRGRDGLQLAKMRIGSSTWAEEPVVADADNDGHADLLVASNRFKDNSVGSTGVFVLQDIANQWTRTRRIWNQHSYHVTNVNEDGTIPVNEQPHWLTAGLNSFRLNQFLPGESSDSADSFTYVASDGSLDSTPATVRIAIRPRNSTPQFTSTPAALAATGVSYTYVAQATDPDAGDVLSFSLATAPAGMTIDEAFGAIHWTPAAGQLGPQPVVVKVRDTQGAFALQSFTVQVVAPATVPSVVGLPQADAQAAVAAAGFAIGAISTLSHPVIPAGSVVAQQPAGGAAAPPGVAVALTLSTGPAVGDTDDDGDGFTPNQGDCNDRSAATHPGATDVPGNGIDENCDGVDAPDPATIDADHDGFTPAQGDCNDGDPARNPGAVDIPGNGIDENCNGADSVSGDTSLPTASLATPADGAELSLATEFEGTASDDHLLGYRLEFGPVDGPPAVIASGTTPVIGGALGRVDPTRLENGLYRARLVVEDVNGNVAADERVFRVTGNAKVGLVSMSFLDLQVPVAGIPISIVRSYDNRVKTGRDFGVGWSLAVSAGKFQNNRTPGVGWTIDDQPFLGSFLPCVGGTTETRTHFTQVRLSDRESYDFALKVTNATLGITGACEGTASFEFVSGTTPGATLEILDGTSVIYLRGGDDVLLDENAFLEGTNVPFDPRRVRLTTIDGRRVELDRLAGITRVEDNNGNAIVIGPGGIQHSSGKSVAFTRDGAGRIVSITDPMGQSLAYGYDGAGDLVRYVDRGGNETTFAYDGQHNLTELRDPLGDRALSAEYDADGRMVAIIDGAGHRVEFTHDLAAREEVVTDAAGRVTRIAYDALGNVSSRQSTVTIAGTVTPVVTTYEHDALGNPTVVVDPDGVRTETTFDHENPLADVVDPGNLALRTVRTYTARGDVATLTDPLGHVTSVGYDSHGNLASYTDASGTVTAVTYDASGRPHSGRDALGTETRNTYDAFGRLTRQDVIAAGGALASRHEYTYDANGNRTTETVYRTVDGTRRPFTTAFAYDARGLLVAVTDPLGHTSRTEYNALGKPVATIDALGRRTAVTYDDLGQPTRTDFPDGTFETKAYDAAGNVVQTRDRGGRLTAYEYDELNRRVATTLPGGAVQRTVYSPGGRVVATIDAAGNRTDFEYDTAGRRTKIISPAVIDAATAATVRPETRQEYDAAGRPVAIVDPRGMRTSTVFDAMGRALRREFPDGSVQQTTYDALGRAIARIDEGGRTTAFAYDALDHLTQVTDAMGGETRYAYDEDGHLVSRTDALGRKTTYGYDALGRLERRRLPAGEEESLTYDAAGNVASHTDFNGATTRFEYDVVNRLTRKILPDGSVVTFAYTPSGQRASVTDTRGTVTYDYDDTDRLTRVTQPGGEAITYAYDANGVMREMSSPAGPVAYESDALGRLLRVTAPTGETRYGYDLAGNLAAMTLPNGIVSRFGYDSRNRLTSIQHARSGFVLASFDYELTPTGRRGHVTEADGSEETYGYDALDRLVSDVRTGTHPWSIAYDYDAVGNRTRMVRDTVVTAYAYDADDRLITAGGATYSYDAAGNVQSLTNALGTTTYGWDAENQLRQVNGPTAALQFGYDADGNRISSQSAGSVTRFLVSPANPTGLPQVLEERNGAGDLQAQYVYGNRLLGMVRGGASSFYHADALGSTRLLSDAAGAATASYAYDAYGNLLGASGAAENPYQFAGEQFQGGAGLYYMRARYYDPSTGRFFGRDPFAGTPGSPMSEQPYLYGADDPVNRTDRTGLFSLIEIATSLGIEDTLRALDLGRTVVQECSLAGKLDIAQEALFWGQFAALGPAIAHDLFTSADHNAGVEFSVTAKRVLTVFSAPEKIKEGEVSLGFQRDGSKKLSFTFKRIDDVTYGADLDLNDISRSSVNFGAGVAALSFSPANPTDSSLAIKKSFDLFEITKCAVPLAKGTFNLEGSAGPTKVAFSATVGLESIAGLIKFKYPLIDWSASR